MQIVIDISNWLYNAIMECKEPLYSKLLGDAVRDGTPLPKEQEDLRDALHIAQTERDKWKERAAKLAAILGIRDCDIDNYEVNRMKSE